MRASRISGCILKRSGPIDDLTGDPINPQPSGPEIRISGPDFGRSLVGKAQRSASGRRSAGRKADFEGFRCSWAPGAVQTPKMNDFRFLYKLIGPSWPLFPLLGPYWPLLGPYWPLLGPYWPLLGSQSAATDRGARRQGPIVVRTTTAQRGRFDASCAKPYEFIGFGAIAITKPYEIIGVLGHSYHQTL